jgi:hypothetical protein
VHGHLLAAARIAPDAGVAPFHREGAEPTHCTRPPRASVAVIWSKIAPTINSTSATRRCGLLAARSAMSWALVNAGSCSTTARYTQHLPS